MKDNLFNCIVNFCSEKYEAYGASCGYSGIVKIIMDVIISRVSVVM